MKKKYLLLLPAALVITVCFFACRKFCPPGNGPGYVTSIKKDSMTVDFPAGSVKSPSATLQKVSNPDIVYIFNETAELFRAAAPSPFQYVLNIGTNGPQNDSIVLSLILPQKKDLPVNYGYELFAQIYQDGGEETLDLFDIIPSVYNPASNTLVAVLPASVFTNKRNGNNTFEAVFTLAATPGISPTVSSVSQLNGIMSNAATLAATGECKAGQINCPIGSVDDCSQKMTSPFARRVDPITGIKNKEHTGIDFGVPVGTPVTAAKDGKIEKIRTQTDKNGNVTGYGLYMVVRHLDGSATLYGHLSNTSVQVGNTVVAGQPIALSGNSGRSTGPHLHFEYVPNGEIVQSKNRIDAAPCISEGNANGAITVRDNGNLADDAFELYLDGVLIGRTAIGASNSVALSNLRPGTKTLTLTCTIAPDNAGTYEVILNDGITFTDTGGNVKSDVLVQGGSVSWPINIPATRRFNFTITPSRPNRHIE